MSSARPSSQRHIWTSTRPSGNGLPRLSQTSASRTPPAPAPDPPAPASQGRRVLRWLPVAGEALRVWWSLRTVPGWVESSCLVSGYWRGAEFVLHRAEHAQGGVSALSIAVLEIGSDRSSVNPQLRPSCSPWQHLAPPDHPCHARAGLPHRRCRQREPRPEHRPEPSSPQLRPDRPDRPGDPSPHRHALQITGHTAAPPSGLVNPAPAPPGTGRTRPLPTTAHQPLGHLDREVALEYQGVGRGNSSRNSAASGEVVTAVQFG